MRNYIFLLLIIIFAGIFRFYGINYDLPYVFNVDEPYIMDKTVEVADGNLRHGVVIRGSLPYYVNGLAIKLVTIINPSLLKGQKTIRDAYKIDKIPFYIIGRTISSFYSIAEIIVLFFIGKLIFNSSIALLAAFFTSISNLSINYAHQITPDTALSATILATLYFAVKASLRNNYRLFFISAFFVGIATAQKLTGILLLPIFFILFISSKLFRKLTLYSKILSLLSFIVCIFFAYFLSYPYLFQDINKIIYEWQWENQNTIWWNQLIINNIGILGRIGEYFYWLRTGTGSFLFYLSIVGIIISFLQKQFILTLLSLFMMIFLIGISIPIPYYDRWVIPLIPFMSLFTAKLFFELLLKFQKRNSPLFFYILLILISIPPLLRSIFFTLTFASSDTRILEANWVQENNIMESDILRDLYTSVTIPKEGKMLTRISESDLRNYRYFIASSYFYPRFFSRPNLSSEKAEKYIYIFRNFQKIAEFLPQKISIHLDDFDLIFSSRDWNLYQIRGPRIMIYKLY